MSPPPPPPYFHNGKLRLLSRPLLHSTPGQRHFSCPLTTPPREEMALILRFAPPPPLLLLLGLPPSSLIAMFLGA